MSRPGRWSEDLFPWTLVCLSFSWARFAFYFESEYSKAEVNDKNNFTTMLHVRGKAPGTKKRVPVAS